MKNEPVSSLFVDTSAFAAIQNASDTNHRPALEFWRRTAASRAAIYTTDYIFDETYTLMLRCVGREAALDFGHAIMGSSVVQMIYVDEYLQQKAWRIAIKYSDKRFSFTDCVSFAVIDELKIEATFCFDIHFQQYGSLIVKPDKSLFQP